MKVNLVQRKVLAGKDKGQKRVYGQVKCSEKIPFEELCGKISVMSAATRGDVELVIGGFLEVMKEHLALGNIVQLGSLGNFRLLAGSRGVKEKEDFHTSMMKKPRIVFSPGKRLRKAMNDATFEPVAAKVEWVDEDCFLPHE